MKGNFNFRHQGLERREKNVANYTVRDDPSKKKRFNSDCVVIINVKWKEWQAYLTLDDETSSELRAMKTNKGSVGETEGSNLSGGSSMRPTKQFQSPAESSRQRKLWLFLCRLLSLSLPAPTQLVSTQNWQPFCFVKSSLKKKTNAQKAKAQKREKWRQSECHDNWIVLHYEMEFHKRTAMRESGKVREFFYVESRGVSYWRRLIGQIFAPCLSQPQLLSVYLLFVLRYIWQGMARTRKFW